MAHLFQDKKIRQERSFPDFVCNLKAFAFNKPQNLRLIERKNVTLRHKNLLMYIYQQKDWPAFRWDKAVVDKLLNRVYGAVGFLMGRLSVIGFDEKMLAAVESISHDIIASSETEGVALNNEEVRSSVAHQLGVQLPNRQSSSRYIDGVVKMALDATVNYNSPLTRDRIFGSFFLRQLRQLLTTFFLCCHFNMTTTGTTLTTYSCLPALREAGV